MSHKNKTKELIGRGLNSYHVKALQQASRIEKKNKEQNHKINTITSALDNDHLTKIEEGSAISLDNSKEGIVEVIGLEGNTMVNYCTDGSKELTLNGDIDVEGTFITTREGVDGGRVDVMCEGNTLVNLLKTEWTNGLYETYGGKNCLKVTKTKYPQQTISTIVAGRTYSLIYHYATTELIQGTTNPFGRVHLVLNKEGAWMYDIPVKDFESNKSNFIQSISVFTIPTNIDFTEMGISGVLRDIDGTAWISDIMILEGDWTNREIPSYFTGLQSSFEEKINEQGKYEVEILSQSNSLFSCENYNVTLLQGSSGYTKRIPITITSDRYIFYAMDKNKNLTPYSGNFVFRIIDEKEQYSLVNNTTGKVLDTSRLLNRKLFIDIYHNNLLTSPIEVYGIVGVNAPIITYSPHKFNKIKVLINEPLRGIGDVKDKLCIKDGKLMVERKCRGITFDGSDENWLSGTRETNEGVFYHYGYVDKYRGSKMYGTPCACNNFKFEVSWENTPHVFLDNYNTITFVSPSLNDYSVDTWILWLQQNPTVVVYELEEPYYEEVTNEYGEPITLEGYENGTLYIDSVIPPKVSIRYTPNVGVLKEMKTVKEDNLKLSLDINHNILPYIMDVDLAIMEAEILTQNKTMRMEVLDMTSMQKRTGEMLERLIRGKSLTEQEARERVIMYLEAKKITAEQAEHLNGVILEVYV